MLRKLSLFVVLTITALLFATPAAAVDPIPGNCLDYANVGHMVVCYLGNQDNQDGTTTWTYAVKSNTTVATNSGIEAIECHPTLRKLKLEVCPGDVTAPTKGVDMYTTFSPFAGVTGRVGVEYDVDFYGDTTEGWIAYMNPSDALGYYPQVEVDIFQFTQASQANPGVTDTTVWVGELDSYGNNPLTYSGTIDGPVCSGTTAVNLDSLNASSGLFARLLSWIGLR